MNFKGLSFSKYAGVLALFIGVFQSCIKDAPLNPEADIEAFDVDARLLTGKTFVNQATNTIQLYVTKEALEKGITPTITVSKNAKLSPASGTLIRLNDKNLTYTVTSELGTNQKTYTVEVVNVGNWSFAFEKWLLNPEDRYENPIEDDNSALWSSGNQGVALSGVPKQVNAYPTRSTKDGYLGSTGAEMVTIEGTPLSAIVGIYLYAGSVFIGNFNSSVVLIEPLAATEFGAPYVGLPARLTGYYKYAPGAVYQDENKKPVPGKTDECSVYAVLFEGPDRLNGTNIHTSNKIVATAELADGSAKSAFTRFDVPFVYKPGYDPAGKNLMLTIVASSSKDGDHYRGAIGSRLVVDSVSVVPQ